MANAKTCSKCGGEFVGGVRDTNRRFCSVECRETFWDEKRRKGVTRGEWLKGRYASPVATVSLSVTDAAYVAGFMDGEGHIGIVRETRPGNASGFRYHCTMEVANTNLAVLERVKASLGGNGWLTNPERPSNPRGRPLYRIRFSRRQIAYILPMLMPYMTVKKAAGDCVLRFIGVMEAAPMRTSRFHDQFEALYQEAKALNKRGT